MEEERWAKLIRFPTYAISDRGRVINQKRETLVRPLINNTGVGVVGLIDSDGRHTTKSIALLVAETFIPRPDDRFDTPINLDGNRTNNVVENILWRPRPFAVMFNRQFRLPRFYTDRTPLEIVDTGEWFSNVVAPVTRFGLIYSAIFVSCHNRTRVFPTEQRYRFSKTIYQ